MSSYVKNEQMFIYLAKKKLITLSVHHKVKKNKQTRLLSQIFFLIHINMSVMSIKKCNTEAEFMLREWSRSRGRVM